jgi:hypothetical protein
MAGTNSRNRDSSGKPERTGLPRRKFLRALGAGTTVAAAGAGTFAGTARADSENNDEKRKPRYHVTDHIKNYYRVNRYPS